MQNEIKYRFLNELDCHPSLLNTFYRYQETKKVWFNHQGDYSIKEDFFIDEWDDEKKRKVIQSLKSCIQNGGVVIGAYGQDNLIGFANIEGEKFGSRNQYLELPYIHVSSDYRGLGIGKILFLMIVKEARKLGAEKLYIGAHPSIETQAFYQSLGCVYAKEINDRVYAQEPLDIQLEYVL